MFVKWKLNRGYFFLNGQMKPIDAFPRMLERQFSCVCVCVCWRYSSGSLHHSSPAAAFPLTLVFAFHYAPYSGVQLPLCTTLSGAGGGWKHWLSKLVFKWNFAGLRVLHYSWPLCEERSGAPRRSSLRFSLQDWSKKQGA